MSDAMAGLKEVLGCLFFVVILVAIAIGAITGAIVYFALK